MIKASFATSNLKDHLEYIAGLGKHSHKHLGEDVTCDPSIASLEDQERFRNLFGSWLEPDLSKKQRRSKRTALKLIISWPMSSNQLQEEFLADFIDKHFSKCLVTWAKHSIKGENRSHYHLVVCYRDSEGNVLKMSPRDIYSLKNSYLTLSKKYGLITGWDSSSLKRRKPRSKPFMRDRKAKASTVMKERIHKRKDVGKE